MFTYFYAFATMIILCFAPPVTAAWDEAPKDGSWLPPVIAILLAVLVLGANMKNSKRGHQD